MARIAHYASYLVGDEEVFGVATLIAGGYSFRPDDSRAVRLVSYKDVNLMLYGLVDVATSQYIDDEIRGGPVGVCLSREEGVN
jgi:hypothetical protein